MAEPCGLAGARLGLGRDIISSNSVLQGKRNWRSQGANIRRTGAKALIIRVPTDPHEIGCSGGLQPTRYRRPLSGLGDRDIVRGVASQCSQADVARKHYGTPQEVGEGHYDRVQGQRGAPVTEGRRLHGQDFLAEEGYCGPPVV